MREKEMANLRSAALACEKANRSIAFRVLYADLAGDVIAGLLLSQIVYWHGDDKNGVDRRRVKREGWLWVAKSYAEWYEELRLSKYQAMRALGKLERRGFIETRVFKWAGVPTKHVRVCWDKFTPALLAGSVGKPVQAR
jgi:hypothetical protein